ncbi:MAG TPA: PDDEXK nuclease domain-containing protein [Solirubrobacteraceae bacterium]|jgi:predicted nuclease of restriction endonuclease-like (RecB) superfamily
MSKALASSAPRLLDDYSQCLAGIQARIAASRTRAALAVNSELIGLYWDIGHDILLREGREGWGARVIDRLATDLRRDFPEMKGLSRSNLHYMRQFAASWPDSQIVPQAVGQLPWGHIRCLLDKLDEPAARLWYAAQALENSWSRKVLEAQIASDLRGRQGSTLSSFEHALPQPHSQLVRDALKDPYNFEFLALSQQAKERDLELALLNNVQSFLLEMGRGFALAGRQFPLRIRDRETGRAEEFFLDLLFYNYILRRFVVVDLKIEDFKPEFAGKMNFYLNAVDELERQPGDEASIGLVLCPGRASTVTEWALRGIHSPVAVARYTTSEVTFTDTPPSELQPALPELPHLASELSGILEGSGRTPSGGGTHDEASSEA